MTQPQRDQAWRVRAVQLDLARQRETLDELDRFFRFAAGWGYNTVQFYLEGCVRTEHFPYRPVEETYSAEDLRRIGERANEHNLIVIPATNTLGHAEHFIGCDELAHLAEPPRAIIGSEAFCISRDETYDFLAGYLADLAELLPGEHLHVGCDEAWTIGQCEHCRKAFGPDAPFSQMLRDHLLRLHGMVRDLDRRMWIWDDCLAYLTEDDLAALPRDIVLCLWEYKAERVDPSGVGGQFNGSLRWDRLADYARLGFEAVVCPRAMDLDNASALRDYARRYDNVLGGIQTMWGLKQVFLPSSMIPVAFAGQLFSDLDRPADDVWQQTARGLFPQLSAAQRSAVRAACTELRRGPPPVGRLKHFGPMTSAERTRFRMTELAAIELRQSLQQTDLDDLQRNILEELLVALDFDSLAGLLRRALPSLSDPRITTAERHDARETLQEARREYARLAERFAAKWQRARPGLPNAEARRRWQAQLDALDALLDQADPNNPPGLLVLRLVLPDPFGSPHLRAEVCCEGQWREVLAGVFKPPDLFTSLYTIQAAVDPDLAGRVDALRLTVTGFGPLGIAHAAVHTAEATRTPTGAEVLSGPCVEPDALLLDDSRFTRLGEPDLRRTFLEYSEQQPAKVEMTLWEPKPR